MITIHSANYTPEDYENLARFKKFALRSNQKNFVEAFIWLFGGTKKFAKEIYRKAEKEYIDLIIKTYAKQNRLAFWED